MLKNLDPNNALNKILDFLTKLITGKGRVRPLFLLVWGIVVPCFIGGTLFWLTKDQLARKYILQEDRSNFIFKLDEEKFHTELPSLLKHSKAHAVSIWVIDVGDYKKRLVYRYVSGSGIDDILKDSEFKLFNEKANSENFIRVLQKKVACTDFRAETYYGDRLSGEGVSYVCFSPVPPEGGQLLAMLELEYLNKPEEMIKADEGNADARRQFNNRLLRASNNIIKKGK